LILSLLGTPVSIANKERFPNAKWVEMPKRIGEVGDQGLYFLGVDEDGQNLVGTMDEEEPTLSAIPLYELLNHSTEKISIPKSLPDLVSTEVVIDFYADQELMGTIRVVNNTLVFPDDSTHDFARFVTELLPVGDMDLNEWAESLPYIVHGRTYAVKKAS
jgi:hypothetical protein